MLNIYTNSSKIPEDKVYVSDPEKLMAYLILSDSELDSRVLHEIEQGRKYDNYHFIDRFGCKCPLDWLSTTSKVLLGIEQTDFIINGTELGYNGYQFLCSLDRGYVFLPHIPPHLPNMEDGPVVCVNGQQYESFYDAWIGGC